MALNARRKLVQLQSGAQDAGAPCSRDLLGAVAGQASASLANWTGSVGTKLAVALKPLGRRRKAASGSTVLCFGSISLSAAPADSTPGRRAGDGKQRQRKQPQWMIASASEPFAPKRELSGVPAWRTMVGNLAAGATAGCAVEAALYPIDTIKTRVQASLSGGGLSALLKTGGGRALYAGVLGNLVGVAPASAIFMAFYEPVKQAVAARAPRDRQFLGPLAGGAAAGLAASLVRVPTEVVKQRVQTGEFSGALKALRSIVAREGAKGLFAGYGSFLLRDLPFDAIEFLAYEQIKVAYKASLGGRRDIQAYETSAIGAAAGVVTALSTTPLDVIKTRLMTQGNSGRYAGVLDCATKIIKTEGAGAMFKGWQPRVIWIGIGGMVFFTALEEAKKLYAPKPRVTKLQ